MTNTNDMREAFERAFPKPSQIKYNGPTNRYYPNADDDQLCQMAAQYQFGWEVWQSQQAQGEPYGYVYDGQLLCDEQDFADYFDGAQYDISTMTPVYTAPPAPTAVPDGWKLVPVKPTLGMLAALAWAGDEDLALGHAEINREVISNYGAMLTASPAPEHSGDGNEMVPALRQYRHNYGGGFVFAYDKEQTDRIVTGLVKALEPFAECASELDGSPEDGIEPTDDDEWAKFRLLVSDYRRARSAIAAYRKGA